MGLLVSDRFNNCNIIQRFRANVLAYDAFPKEGVDHICTQVPLDELLAKSDVISIHAPYIPANGKVITKEFISKMKPGAILVNTARGELQDIDAIIKH